MRSTKGDSFMRYLSLVNSYYSCLRSHREENRKCMLHQLYAISLGYTD